MGQRSNFLVERLRDAGLEGEVAYEVIIDESYRTNVELNKQTGSVV
jgi:hypothetical protein